MYLRNILNEEALGAISDMVSRHFQLFAALRSLPQLQDLGREWPKTSFSPCLVDWDRYLETA